MNPLESAINAMWASLATASDASVTYRRGGISVQLATIPGKSQSEVDSGDGYVRSVQLNDFIFKSAELGLTPQPGDRIEWQGRHYDVAQTAGGNHYEFVGGWPVLYRVHTREVAND